MAQSLPRVQGKTQRRCRVALWGHPVGLTVPLQGGTDGRDGTPERRSLLAGALGQEARVLRLRLCSWQLRYPEPCRDEVLRMNRWICFLVSATFHPARGSAGRDPLVWVRLGRGCPPLPPTPAPGLRFLGRWHPPTPGTARCSRSQKRSSLWRRHLLQMISAPLSLGSLPLAVCNGLALQQQFSGWQGFDGTRWQIQLPQVTEGTLELGSSTRGTPETPQDRHEASPPHVFASPARCQQLSACSASAVTVTATWLMTRHPCKDIYSGASFIYVPSDKS